MSQQVDNSAPDPSVLLALVKRAQSADGEAFALLVRELQDMAVGYAYSRLGDRDLAEDAAQDAFFDAYRLLPTLREPAAFITWLRRIILKQCDRITRQRAWKAVSPDVSVDQLETTAPLVDAAPDSLTALELREREVMVRRAVVALPEQQRVVIALFYFGDRSVAQIAAFLEVPVGTVKSRLAAARSTLREWMEVLIHSTLGARRPSSAPDFEKRVRALMLAAAEGNAALVAAMLAEDAALADALAPHPYWGGTPRPLQVAAEWGRAAAVRILLDAGVDPDSRLSGKGYAEWSALQLAAHKGHVETAELLILRGATIDAWSAAALGDVESLRKLIDEDPTIVSSRGPSGATPLHFASTADVASLLVDRGADADAHDDADWTPLHTTAFGGVRRRPAARWLADRLKDVDIFAAAALDDAPGLERAIERNPSHVQARTTSVDAATNSSRITPLHLAAALGNTGTALALLRAKADLEAPSADGHRPLHYAAKGGHREVAKVLLDHGADRSARDDQHAATPAEWAAFFGHGELRDWLAQPAVA